MINKKVLMSDAKHFRVDHPINPYYGDTYVDNELAQKEHDSIRQAFIEAGIEVLNVPSPVTSQDGVYTANWALVRGRKAILSSLPEVRKTEELYAKQVLEDLGIEVINAPEGLKFSGQGDALACGDYLFCGSRYRSDEEAQKFAAKELGYEIIQLETVPQTDENGIDVVNKSSGWPDSFFYDIDLALAIIDVPRGDKPGIIAYCPEAFTPDSQRELESLSGFKMIPVSLEEAKGAFALNLVSTGSTVIMSNNAPELKSKLESLGLRTITPEISQLAKGGGYIRCTSLTIG